MAASDDENDEDNDDDDDDDSGSLPNVSVLIRKSAPNVPTITNSETVKRTSLSKTNSKVNARGGSSASLHADQGKSRSDEAPVRTLLHLQSGSVERSEANVTFSLAFSPSIAGRADAEAALQGLEAQMRAERQTEGNRSESDEDDHGERETVTCPALSVPATYFRPASRPTPLRASSGRGSQYASGSCREWERAPKDPARER